MQGRPPRRSAATSCCADEYVKVVRLLGLGVLLGLAWVAVALGVLLLAVGLGCVFAPMTPKMTSKATMPPSAVSTLWLRINSTNIPSNVLKTLEEAISCHAIRSYVAAGMMVRKTLEELCEDRKAKGKNLKEKIADLGNAVMMPKELLDGLDDLRLLGNECCACSSQDLSSGWRRGD